MCGTRGCAQKFIQVRLRRPQNSNSGHEFPVPPSMEPPNQRCGYPSLLRARSCQDDLPQSVKLRVADKTTRTFWATSLKPASELYGHIHAKARSIVSRCQKSKTLHTHSGKTRALRRPPWLVGYANHSPARVYFAENSRVRLRASVLLASVPRFFRTTDIVVAVEQGNRGAVPS